MDSQLNYKGHASMQYAWSIDVDQLDASKVLKAFFSMTFYMILIDRPLLGYSGAHPMRLIERATLQLNIVDSM